MDDKNLVKVYSDRTYVSTVTVRHSGTTVALAMDADRRVYYSVLDLDQAQGSRGPLDAAYWNADPALLPFPGELVDSAPQTTASAVMPVVKRGSRTEAAQPELLLPADRDPFLSTTARLTAAAPLQAVSDGRYILVFRQSITAADPNAVFQLQGGGLSGDATRTDYAPAGGPKVAAVDASLLCDRFVLVGAALKPVVEVRYQRSRSKFVRASDGDTMGTRDMDGQLFYEPTLKLSFVTTLTRGAFCALLLPTAVDGVSRWQIFAANDATGRIECFNLPRSEDGMFSVAGVQLYTSPDPRYVSSVLERAPGMDPNTKLPLVPVPASTDRGGTALRFSAAGTGYVTTQSLSAGVQATGKYTAEAWVRPTAPGGSITATWDEGRNAGFQLGLDGQGNLIAAQDGAAWTLTSTSPVPMNAWSHVAVVYDGTAATLYLNGTSVGATPVTAAPDPSTSGLLGASRNSAGSATGFFTGDVDEVRIWNTARTGFADRGRRLTGIEPGLVAYYPMSEGGGTTVTSSTRNQMPGTFAGSAVTWVSSTAPVGDGPGLSRDTFAFAGRTVASGLAATLYYQQELEATGYSTEPAAQKRQTRVLLACATSGPAPQGGSAARSYVTTLDVAVSRAGRLAQIPGQVAVTAIGLPDPNAPQDQLAAAQSAVAAAQTALNQDRTTAQTRQLIESQYYQLEPEYNHLQYWNERLAAIFRGWEISRAAQLLAAMNILRGRWQDAEAARLRLAADEAAVTAAQNALATMTHGMQGGPEVVLPMPPVSVDRTGLSVFGALLTFAWTSDAPALLDSSTGDVVLYFRGGSGQFFSAYYATTVSRAIKGITVGDGILNLVALDTTANLADFTVTVSPGPADGQCQVQIVRGAVTETFAGVPRSAATVAGVLNGVLPPGGLLGVVASVQDQVVSLAAPLAAALTAGTAVTIGGRRRTLAAGSDAGAATITVTSDSLQTAVGGEVRLLTYDYAAQATSNVPGVSLASGSQIVAARAGTAVAAVPDGAAAVVAPALTPRWRGDSPGRAMSFDGTAQCLTLPAAGAANIGSTGDLTVEAWANPAYVNSRSRIVHAPLAAAPYTLGLEGATLPSALQFIGGADSVDCGSTLSLTGTDFTVEAWALRGANGTTDYTLGHGSAAGATDQSLHIGFRPGNTFHFGFFGDDLDTPAYTDLAWHHWAVVYVAATRQRTVYRDGLQVAQDTATGAYAGAGKVLLGAATFAPGTGVLQLDEVRVWGTARTPVSIATSMNTRLSGREPGLLAYWSFQNASTADRSGNGHNGTVIGSPTQVPSGLRGYTLVAGVGSQFVRSTGAFPAAQWGHVAVSFKQDWAMALDGSSFLDAGGPGGLDLSDDLTIEAFVKLTSLGTVQGLVSKGAIASGIPDSAVPYALYVQANGELAFTFEAGPGGPGQQKIYTSNDIMPTGTFTKVAVTRKSGANTSGGVGITFYINGRATTAGTKVYDGAKPVGNDANCELGRFRIGVTPLGLNGTLSEVRIWNSARDADQIGAAITTKASGLIAWWTFPEARGTTTADRCSTYPATLRGATRVRTPDPAGNAFALYRNGTLTPATLLPAGDPLATAGYGTGPVTVGGFKNADGSLGDGLAGVLDDIRIWRTARTQEQILDNMFSRVRGELRDLLAYYSFDISSTAPNSTTVSDNGLRGNDLTPSTPPPGIALSTAPISDDTAEVRSALTGVTTPFNTLVTGTPCATEYADMQVDAQGQLLGVMKRSYAYLRGGSLVLLTGFKLGELTTTWVGQAQFDPQLIGYIEGAPPVPSENLIAGTAEDYTDKSTVNFVQADGVTNTLSSARNTSVDMAAKATWEFAVEDETQVVTAPLGAGTAKPAVKVKAGINGSFELKYANGWSSDTQVSQGATTTRTSSVALTGHWEGTDPGSQVNPAAGQRWVPANTGFAIVQSDTADLYALRLAHSGALVAYRMVPNPDIPRDWNIITFRINPRYTKQGTLDGLIGFASGAAQGFADPDFPHAADPGTLKGEFSYYRPTEAYALKRRIQRQEQQLQGFYDSVSTETHTADPVRAAADRVLAGMMGGTGTTTGLDTTTGDAAAGRAANKSASRRNLANTYVWTAAGGLFSETTATTDQVTEVTGGNYSVSGSATLGGSIEYTAGPVSAKLAGEVTLGGGYSVTRTKTKQSTRTFSLDVVCQPGRNLQQMNGTTPVVDSSGQPVLVPGRVDGYRFMSFYLDTTADNYEDFYGKVIDPQWLETSTDPGAIALRQTRQGDRKPPCWRILHRVTFISRVLPIPAATDTATLHTVMRTQNIASDIALVQRLQPYLANATTTLTALTAAVQTALTTHFPPLVPYTADVTNIVAVYYSFTT